MLSTIGLCHSKSICQEAKDFLIKNHTRKTACDDPFNSRLGFPCEVLMTFVKERAPPIWMKDGMQRIALIQRYIYIIGVGKWTNDKVSPFPRLKNNS